MSVSCPSVNEFSAILFSLFARSRSNSPRSFQRFRRTLRRNFNWIRQQMKNVPQTPIVKSCHFRQRYNKVCFDFHTSCKIKPNHKCIHCTCNKCSNIGMKNLQRIARDRGVICKLLGPDRDFDSLGVSIGFKLFDTSTISLSTLNDYEASLKLQQTTHLADVILSEG